MATSTDRSRAPVAQLTRRTLLAASLAAIVGCGRRRNAGSSPTTAVDDASTAPQVVNSSATPADTSAVTEPSTNVSDPASSTTTPVTSTTVAEPPTPGAWAAADFASIDTFLADTGGEAAVIYEGGELIHSWYAGGDPAYARDIASAQKSVLSILVGIAVDDGVLDIEQLVDDLIGPDWSPSDTATVTVRHLLSMTSGLNPRLRSVQAPGEGWIYSDAFAGLFSVVETVTGMALNDFATSRLFDSIGATGAEFRDRRGGAPGPGAALGLVASAEQLAAVGLMVLGHRTKVVSDEWLTVSFTRSQPFNESYGLLWWLNGQPSYVVPEGRRFDGALIPAAPADLVAALGKDDQKLYVSNELDLVVVRLGNKASRSALALSSFDNDLWTRLLAERNRT